MNRRSRAAALAPAGRLGFAPAPAALDGADIESPKTKRRLVRYTFSSRLSRYRKHRALRPISPVALFPKLFREHFDAPGAATVGQRGARLNTRPMAASGATGQQAPALRKRVGTRPSRAEATA